MEIEQKERERIEAKYPTERQGLEVKTMFHWMDVQLSRQGSAMEEHLHLQKEVIQPLRRDVYYWKSLYQTSHDLSVKMKQQIVDSEAENKALREALKEIERVCDNNNPTHSDIWRRAYQELTKNEG